MHYQGITYQENSQKEIFKDPGKLIFGLGLTFGSSHHHSSEKERNTE
ncbi:MAG: hypothetical protein HY063_15495 [Bacteroidetes bacterium]|nr:hypothetical protein [Bacteroidota bacterium]